MPEPTPTPPLFGYGAGSARRWPHRVGIAFVVVIALTTAAGWTVILFFPEVWASWRGQALATPSAAPTGPRQGDDASSRPSPPTRQMNPEPRLVTLRTTDLPPGHHVLHEGSASFSSTGRQGQPPSWDVVFAPDLGQPAEVLLIESVVAVYPDNATAAAAVDIEDAAERSAHALQQAPVPSLGDQQAIWIQPAQGHATDGVTRVTWRSVNVVGQVSVLGPMTPLVLEMTLHLARVEQDRIEGGQSAATGIVPEP